MKKVELLLDENNYVCSYGVIMTPVLINTEDEENIYAKGSLDNSITMKIDDEDMEAFSYVYSAYHVVNGEVVLDAAKAEQIYIENNLPYKTEQEKMIDNLASAVKEVINE